MTEEQADKLLDAVLDAFAKSGIEVNKMLTVFAKVQNVIYENVDR